MVVFRWVNRTFMPVCPTPSNSSTRARPATEPDSQSIIIHKQHDKPICCCNLLISCHFKQLRYPDYVPSPTKAMSSQWIPCFFFVFYPNSKQEEDVHFTGDKPYPYPYCYQRIKPSSNFHSTGRICHPRLFWISVCQNEDLKSLHRWLTMSL